MRTAPHLSIAIVLWLLAMIAYLSDIAHPMAGLFACGAALETGSYIVLLLMPTTGIGGKCPFCRRRLSPGADLCPSCR